MPLPKTFIVKQCMEKCQGIHPGLKQCYLNGSSFSINPQSVYQHIDKNIYNISSSDCRANMLSKKLGVNNHRLPYVVILDEIDFFIDPGKKSHSGNTCIETLVKWASDHSKRFILIGISNSVGDSSAKFITGISQVNNMP
jgi:Cdc6-like AAA superfamily ATPase